ICYATTYDTERTQSAGGGRILVVDDRPTITTVVKYFLELDGYEVIIAADGQVGLEEARRQRPDVVITDVNMPVMGGVALAIELSRTPLPSGVRTPSPTPNPTVETEPPPLSPGLTASSVHP